MGFEDFELNRISAQKSVDAAISNFGFHVQEGYEIAIGDCAYRVKSVQNNGEVLGMIIVEHGHFVIPSTTLYTLDLRLGWKMLYKNLDKL